MRKLCIEDIDKARVLCLNQLEKPRVLCIAFASLADVPRILCVEVTTVQPPATGDVFDTTFDTTFG